MPELVLEQLRRGLPVDDAGFDRVYPADVRHLSHVHWTPVAVATLAARFLVGAPGARVLDVGAGAGKLCLIGALVTAGTFHGVEQRATLVEAARAAARLLHAPRTCFEHGDVLDVAWSGFDAFYLYNPFADRLDAFDASVRAVQARLDAARPGTRVATYHGFGGAMPPGYRRGFAGEGELAGLELWTRTA
jgi:hypothetical protein